MTENEIKKFLYKEKPWAYLLHMRSGIAYYESSVDNGYVIYFEVPMSEMDGADFFPQMSAQLLNRWIKTSD